MARTRPSDALFAGERSDGPLLVDRIGELLAAAVEHGPAGMLDKLQGGTGEGEEEPAEPEARRWISFDHEHGEPDRLQFTLDIGAASPREGDVADDDEEYYTRIKAWQQQREKAVRRGSGDRPSHYSYEPPPLYKGQREAIYAAERWALCEASTKSGKTAGCMVWLLDQALRGRPGANYWWVAPTYRQSRMVFRRFERGLPADVYIANRGELTLVLPNGAVLWFLSADRPDNLYGEDVRAAVIDEASRCDETVWFAVRSVLTATKGPARLIGNVKGRNNWFYLFCRRAEAGEPNAHYRKLTWEDAVGAGILDHEEIEDARRQLPENVFKELYEAVATDDDTNPFGLEAIRSKIMPGLSGAAPVCWGWDLAKSLDWVVGIALDAGGQVCGFHRWQGDWRSTIRRIREISGSEVPTLVDSTGVGDPVVEQLQVGRQNVEGLKFTSLSKQQLMEGLAVWIQQEQGGIPGDGWPLQAELENFEFQYHRHGVRYAAPSGMHDDCVCALALAVRVWGKPKLLRGVLIPGGGAEDVAARRKRIEERRRRMAERRKRRGGPGGLAEAA